MNKDSLEMRENALRILFESNLKREYDWKLEERLNKEKNRLYEDHQK